MTREWTRATRVIIQTNYQLGATIKGRRQELRLTQRELASKADMSLRSIIEIESGDGNPRMDSLLRCLAALGMEMIAEPKPADAEENILNSVLQRTKKG
jgi:y4mF family transcriptional regulator